MTFATLGLLRNFVSRNDNMILMYFGEDPFPEKHIFKLISFIRSVEDVLFLKKLDRGLKRSNRTHASGSGKFFGIDLLSA